MKKRLWTIRTAAILTAALLVFLLVPVPARADAVTDYLAVAVGYEGMELSEYVVVGDYHWSELAGALPIYEEAYSYYNGGSSDGTQFNAIVDSARGFLLMDLLEYAGIYYGDIRNLQFYVVDHAGIQAAFDRDYLFQTRYYFEDYNGHLYREYDDDFNVISVDSSECWDYCVSVEPMMALEDNWVSFSEEFEHALPDFDNASAASRFRLLFGQTYPEETLTSSSAKFVRTIYVTLVGQPQFGEMPELDGSYGSHEVTFTASVNTDMRDVLSEFLKLQSTDESVLVITGITVTPDSFYSDLVDITVGYDIVGEGSASITASFASSGIQVASTAAVNGEPEPQEEPEPEPKDDPSNQGSGGGSGSEQGSQAKETKPGGTGTADKKDTGVTAQASVKEEGKPAETLAAGEASEVRKAGVYKLDKEVGEALKGGSRPEEVTLAPAETITQVLIEDNTEEKEARARMLLICTGAGAAGLVAAGGIWESLSFSRRLKK